MTPFYGENFFVFAEACLIAALFFATQHFQTFAVSRIFTHSFVQLNVLLLLALLAAIKHNWRCIYFKQKLFKQKLFFPLEAPTTNTDKQRDNQKSISLVAELTDCVSLSRRGNRGTCSTTSMLFLS